MGANSTTNENNDVPQSTNIKTNNTCCNDANCKDNLAGNFFLPAGLRASIRRLSSVIKRSEEEPSTANNNKSKRGTDLLSENDSNNGENNVCCNDENCTGGGDRLANANFFLPAGVLPASISMRNVFAADTERCSIVRRVSARTLSSMVALDATVVQETSEEENEEPISTVGRSHITAQGICCAVSIPFDVHWYCFYSYIVITEHFCSHDMYSLCNMRMVV